MKPTDEMVDNGPCKNTDRELWREREDDFYANSIFVTEAGGVGINVGGYVIVKPLADWHKDARAALATHQEEGATDDPVCTDCDGTGITLQTERRCSCQGVTPTPPAGLGKAVDDVLASIGAQMANTLYNLAQGAVGSTLSSDHARIAADLSERWRDRLSALRDGEAGS